MTIFSLVAMFYVVCGVLAYGLCLAYFQRNWPSLAKEEFKKDVGTALWFAAFGFFGMLTVLIQCERCRYGLLFRNPHREDW